MSYLINPSSLGCVPAQSPNVSSPLPQLAIAYWRSHNSEELGIRVLGGGESNKYELPGKLFQASLRGWSQWGEEEEVKRGNDSG